LPFADPGRGGGGILPFADPGRGRGGTLPFADAGRFADLGRGGSDPSLALADPGLGGSDPLADPGLGGSEALGDCRGSGTTGAPGFGLSIERGSVAVAGLKMAFGDWKRKPLSFACGIRFARGGPGGRMGTRLFGRSRLGLPPSFAAWPGGGAFGGRNPAGWWPGALVMSIGDRGGNTGTGGVLPSPVEMKAAGGSSSASESTGCEDCRHKPAGGDAGCSAAIGVVGWGVLVASACPWSAVTVREPPGDAAERTDPAADTGLA